MAELHDKNANNAEPAPGQVHTVLVVSLIGAILLLILLSIGTVR